MKHYQPEPFSEDEADAQQRGTILHDERSVEKPLKQHRRPQPADIRPGQSPRSSRRTARSYPGEQKTSPDSSSTEGDSSTASAPSAGVASGANDKSTSQFSEDNHNDPNHAPGFVMNVHSPTFRPATAASTSSNLGTSSDTSTMQQIPRPNSSSMTLSEDEQGQQANFSAAARSSASIPPRHGERVAIHSPSPSNLASFSRPIEPPRSRQVNALSNEEIEAAIQAATSLLAESQDDAEFAGRSASRGGSRSGGSRSSDSGSGYASERERDQRDPGRGGERGGGHGGRRDRGSGDTRSIPPRDTRTLLFVGNLPYRVRWQDLKDLFRRAGTVLRADVSLGPDSRSRGYGTVLLATAEDAGRAIDMLNGYEWQTRVLEVRVDRVGGIGTIGSSGPALSTGPPGAGSGYEPAASTYPGASYASSSSQQQYYGQYGAPTQPDPMPQGRYPAAAGLQQSQHMGLPQGLTAASGGASPMSVPGRTLFVGNLPYHVQWQDLKDLFRRLPSNHPILQGKGMNPTFGSDSFSLHSQAVRDFLGPSASNYAQDIPHIPASMLTFNVLRADVALGPDGRSKGFGTVVFASAEDTERARKVFNGYDFNGRQLKVHYDRLSPGGPGLPTSASPQPSYSSQNVYPSSLSSDPISLTQQMMSLSLSGGVPPHLPQSQGTESSIWHHPRPPPSSASPIPGLVASPPKVAIGPSPRLRQPQTSTFGPEGLEGRRGSISEHQTQLERLEQLQRQVHSRQLQPRQGLSLQQSMSMAGTGSTSKQTNPNRPTHIALPARTFHVEVDPSLSSLDPPEAIHRGTSSGYEGEISGEEPLAGRGSHRYGDQSGDQGQHEYAWELERQREREREQQLFQLLHGSRRQQQQHQQQSDRSHSRPGIPYSTSLSSLVAPDHPAIDRDPTSTSAPVSNLHSPATTFARTSSAGSFSSSSSNSSLAFQDPYQRGAKESFSFGDFSSSSRSSSVVSIYKGLDNLEEGSDLSMGMVETLLARKLRQPSNQSTRSMSGRWTGTSGSSSAAASTRSLPQGLGVSSTPPPQALAVRNWIEEKDEYGGAMDEKENSADEGEREAKRRPPSTSSRAGSATSASEGSGGLSATTSTSTSSGSAAPPLSRQVYSSIKRVRGVPQSAQGSKGGVGSDADISADEDDGEVDEEDERRPAQSTSLKPTQTRPGWSAARRGHSDSTKVEKGSTDRQHPGPIELPPPPPGVPARGSSAPTSKSFNIGEGLFQQYHPFVGEGQHDYAQFDYSGIPTVQARPSHGTDEGQRSLEKAPASEQGQRQQQQETSPQTPIFAPRPQPPTPHALPALTPSMPPFTLVTGNPGSMSHYQARQQRAQQQQASNNRRYGSNAPGTISLPTTQLQPAQLQMFYPQQGQSSQQPLTPPATYVHPLGSPGSPYALGPHHPLHHQYHYHHQHQHFHTHSFVQHPLAQSFTDGGSPAMAPHPPQAMMMPGHASPLYAPQYPMASPVANNFGLGAMSPGAFWGRPGEMPAVNNPYINPAVGAPVRLGGDSAKPPQEPKGYFDQLYMNPGNFGFAFSQASAGGEGGDGAGGLGVTSTRSTTSSSGSGSGQSAIEKEILKDKSPFGSEGVVARSEGEKGQEGSTEGRPSVTHTQSDVRIASPDQPKMRHLRTDPVVPSSLTGHSQKGDA